jgi:pumilio family protein 6
MPTAITTKNKMSGTKRKVAPAVGGNVKESKKAKFDNGSKSNLKTKTSKVVLAKEVEELSLSDSEDSDSDGGVQLDEDELDTSDEDNDVEDGPNVADGLHPERANAVVANSKINSQLLSKLFQLTLNKINLPKRLMRSRSSWHKNEKLQSL